MPLPPPPQRQLLIAAAATAAPVGWHPLPTVAQQRLQHPGGPAEIKSMGDAMLVIQGNIPEKRVQAYAVQPDNHNKHIDGWFMTCTCSCLLVVLHIGLQQRKASLQTRTCQLT